MVSNDKIWIGQAGAEKVFIYPSMANRHGMIAGATGTGKTVTLKVMAESFSDLGVPVFLADIKGDLSGMVSSGAPTKTVTAKMEELSLDKEGYEFTSYPTTFWDVYGEMGIPLRATISEMGPLLLARILDLNDIQTDILSVIFKIADDENLLLVDTKDLRSMISYVSENSKEFSLIYGNMSKQSLAAIIRAIISLESQGGDLFFGEPALNVQDWFQTIGGKGMINILECEKLFNNPTMYSTFLLWMLSELFEILPEAGDLDKPKMVFFFDEAHILFDNASKELLEKIEQVVKLIRSKGVGVYFITQNPKDIPDGVLAQLGNKVQHALRAYTPAEQKGVKTAANSFRPNPEFDTYEAITSLGIGEALVSVLDEDGVPTMVQKTSILPPQSQMGPIDQSLRNEEIRYSKLYMKYADPIDDDSAYEFLQRKALAEAEEEAAAKEEEAARKQAEKEAAAAKKAEEKEAEARKKQIKRATKSVASSAAGTIGREIGNTLGKSVGGSFGKKLGGNVGASLARNIIGTLFKL
ncbi:MAG: DUF853 family protein [Lachnospiraceae bacterium]|nr:DUF853 family protein [Lachnospiraceae bacterium]